MPRPLGLTLRLHSLHAGCLAIAPRAEFRVIRMAGGETECPGGAWAGRACAARAARPPTPGRRAQCAARLPPFPQPPPPGQARNWRAENARAGCGPRYALRRPPLFFAALLAAAYALVRAAARARFPGSAMCLRALSRTTRRWPSALHAFEQYRTIRFRVENSLPHSLQAMATTLPRSLSALAVHRLQWTGWVPPPYGAKSRPHSAQACGSAAFALRFMLLTSRLARVGGRLPRALALRAAAALLARASFMARFQGSASCLR